MYFYVYNTYDSNVVVVFLHIKSRSVEYFLRGHTANVPHERGNLDTNITRRTRFQQKLTERDG